MLHKRMKATETTAARTVNQMKETVYQQESVACLYLIIKLMINKETNAA